MTIWSAPVRYAEADQQGVVFNAHYLTYCDEAMTAFCREHDLLGFAERVHLVASALTWTAPARWGDLIAVEARCTHVGRTSFTCAFEIMASGRPACTVETTYVYVDAGGRSQPIPDDVRERLS